MHLISQKELIDFEITVVSKKGVSRRALQLRPRMMNGDAYGVSRINEARINEGGRGKDGRVCGREKRFEIDESIATWKSWGRVPHLEYVKGPRPLFFYRALTPETPLYASLFCYA